MPLTPSNEDRVRRTLSMLNEIEDVDMRSLTVPEIIEYAKARFMVSIAAELHDIKDELERIRTTIYNTPPR